MNDSNESLRMLVFHNPLRGTYDMVLQSEVSYPRKRRILSGPLTFVDHEPGNKPYPADAIVHLEKEEAQSLMDSLYSAGIRPTDFGSTGDIKAHLADMREITFGLLGQGVIAKPTERK